MNWEYKNHIIEVGYDGFFDFKTADGLYHSCDTLCEAKELIDKLMAEYYMTQEQYKQLLDKLTDKEKDFVNSMVKELRKLNECDELVEEEFATSTWTRKDGVKPATKEQRDFLFQRMREEGYEWDADKKELKKIEQEPAWSDADEERFVSCLKRLGTGNIEQPDTINTMWLKSIKNRVQSIAKFVGEEQYMKGVRDGVNDVIKSPEDYGLLPTPS